VTALDDALDTTPGLPLHLAPVDDERAILAACLQSPRVVDEVLPLIPTSAVFFHPRHGYTWDAIVACWGRGERPDGLNVAAELDRQGLTPVQVEPIFVSDLSGMFVPGPAADPAPYVARILAGWQLRGGDVALSRGRQAIAAPGAGAADDILDAVILGIQAARDAATRERSAVLVGSLVEEVLAGLDPFTFDDEVAALSWPYRDLGQVMNPLMPGQMVTIAGRPGTGKSTMLKDLCEHVSFHLSLPSLLVSWEMSSPEITARVMSSQAQVPLAHLTRRGRLNGDDRARLMDYRAAIAAAPLTIVDAEDTSIGELDRLIRQYKPRLVALDYIQLAVPEGPPEYRRQAVERYSRSVKKLAQRREVPIVIGSQLNRQSEARHGHKPQLSDLRESGAIEQDSDAVILLHRPDLYDKDDRRGEADAIVAKQRNGPTDTVALAALLHQARFADLA
jgi:replicative DNA helicase